jgi:hypothetical protein
VESRSSSGSSGSSMNGSHNGSRNSSMNGSNNGRPAGSRDGSRNGRIASAAMASASSSLPPAGQLMELSLSNGEGDEDNGRDPSKSDASGCSDGSGYGSRDRTKTSHRQKEDESAYGEIGDVGETSPKVDAAAARAISRMQSQSSPPSSATGEDMDKHARSLSESSKSSVYSRCSATLATSDTRQAGMGLGAGLSAAKRLSRTKSMTNYDGVDGEVRPPVPADRMRARSMDGESLLAHTHTDKGWSEGPHRNGDVAKPTVQSRTKSALRRLGGSQKRRLVTSQTS